MLEDFLIDRQAVPANWAELFPAWRERARSGFSRDKSAVSEDLYTFV